MQSDWRGEGAEDDAEAIKVVAGSAWRSRGEGEGGVGEVGRWGAQTAAAMAAEHGAQHAGRPPLKPNSTLKGSTLSMSTPRTCMHHLHRAAAGRKRWREEGWRSACHRSGRWRRRHSAWVLQPTKHLPGRLPSQTERHRPDGPCDREMTGREGRGKGQEAQERSRRRAHRSARHAGVWGQERRRRAAASCHSTHPATSSRLTRFATLGPSKLPLRACKTGERQQASTGEQSCSCSGRGCRRRLAIPLPA